MEQRPAIDESEVAFRRTLYRDLFFEAFSNQAQYGRWILASLLAVHAGGLLAITQSGAVAATLFAACGAFLLWGLVCALVCGGLAWINFTAAMRFYSIGLREIAKGKILEPGGTLKFIVNITLYGTMAVAILSLVLFVLAARAALAVL